MSWLAAKLNRRIQIRKGVQTEDEYGGFSQTYETIATIWAKVQPLKGIREYVSIIRGEALADVETHDFLVRAVALWSLGKEFSTGFGGGYNNILDIEPLKSDMFIFLEEGSAIKGRLFRVVDIKLDEDRREFVKFRGRQVEEQGTGYAV